MTDDVIARTLERLKEHGLTATRLRLSGPNSERGIDGWLRIGRGEQHVDYVVEDTRTLTPATIGGMVTQIRKLERSHDDRTPLLVTGHVTEPMALLLRAMQVQFADTAGNVYLDSPGFYVLVTGRRPAKRPDRQRPGRAFNTAGVKVIFALLCEPDLAAAPYRSIAAASKVSLGAVASIVAALEEAGHLAVSGKSKRLHATRRLLDHWAQGYARTLRPKTLLAIYTAPDISAWREWQLEPGKVCWGGEPAANRLVGYLKPGALTLYAEKPPTHLIIEQRLVQTDEPGPHDHLVEVRRPFWGETLHTAATPDTVPPALVYADLLATGDARCIDTAERIYEEHLARLFPSR